jgi:hypothetical protein
MNGFYRKNRTKPSILGDFVQVVFLFSVSYFASLLLYSKIIIFSIFVVIQESRVYNKFAHQTLFGEDKDEAKKCEFVIHQESTLS